MARSVQWKPSYASVNSNFIELINVFEDVETLGYDDNFWKGYFHQILCLLDIHFSLWTKMLKVTLPLPTSVLMYVFYTCFFSLIKQNRNNGLSCLVWLWQWSKGIRFYFLREKTMRSWLHVTNHAFSKKTILSGKMILAGRERAY